MHPLTLAAIVLLLVAPAYGAQPPEPRAPSIEVAGRAHVEVPADLALLEFGVFTRAPSADAAARENSARMDAAVGAVRKALGPAAQISTGAYTLRPEQVFPREGGAPKVTGYVASNVMQLRTRELKRVGEIIDVAIKSGANQVQRIAFTLSDEVPAQRQALADAVRHARSKAEALAAGLGVKLGPIHSVVEQDVPEVRPLMREAMVARADAAPVTPVEPGLVEVRARVVVRVLLVQ